jgi:hypothetical protein
MNKVIAMLALCAAFACAPKADGAPPSATNGQALGCTMLGASPLVDSSSVTRDVRAGQRYRCVLRDGDAPLIAHLIADSAANKIDSIALEREDGTLVQMLTEGAEESPYRGAEVFRAVDFDNDDRLDLALLDFWGATGNTQWSVWRQDTATRRFVHDSALSELISPVPVAIGGRVCVASHANGGAAGMIYDSVLVCLDGSRWVDSVVASERPGASENVFILTVRERRGDSLVVVRTDTARDTLR